MNEGRQYQIGERVSCACGAEYEFGVEGRPHRQKGRRALSVLPHDSCRLAAGSFLGR